MRVVNIDNLEWIQITVKETKDKAILILKPHINDLDWFEAEPVRHGRWVATKIDATETRFQCSECGREVKCGNDYFMKPTKHVNASYPYCHCGAKMDLKE